MEPIYTNVHYTYDCIVLGIEPNSRIHLVILFNNLSSKCNSQILHLFKKKIFIRINNLPPQEALQQRFYVRNIAVIILTMEAHGARHSKFEKQKCVACGVNYTGSKKFNMVKKLNFKK